MAILKFKDVGISAIAACVPDNISKNSELTDLIPLEEIDKTINTIGVKEKRISSPETCASDLCVAAAERLFEIQGINKDEIDVVIFMSQTSDYQIPATAPLIQHRLGLSKKTACFDVTLACSGYVYSLCTAFSYAVQPHIRKVLLLDGETFSKIISPKDKVNIPLYGDAGTATIIEKGDFKESIFTLYTDGSGAHVLSIPAGGARKPASSDTLKMIQREDNNFRTDHQLYMNGMEVFNFTMREVPKNIKEALKEAELSIDEIDYVVFHQANKFMTDFFAKKLKLPIEKVPYCLDSFGNTSSASIPLTLVSRMKSFIENECPRVLISGFGGGLSWGSAIINLSKTQIAPLLEYATNN